MLVPGCLQVGRTEAAEFVVAGDTRMSSVHFQLECDHQACRLRDLASTNGTFLNGVLISESTLKNDDAIVAGATSFKVSIEQKASVTVPQKIAPAISPSTLPDRVPEQSSVPISKPRPGEARKDIRSTQRSPGRLVASDSAGAVLEIATGMDAGRKIMLRSGQTVTVGRTEQADVVVRDPQISAKHFMLKNSRSGWQVLDLNSSAGTYLNGNHVTMQRLSSGDRIAAGSTEFTVNVGLSAVGGGESPSDLECPFRKGLYDEDKMVRREALYAAAWTRQPWLLDCLRKEAAKPSLDNFDLLYMLAVLARPSDQATVLTLGGLETLGAKRFEILAAYGHPLVIPTLLKGMAGKEMRSAIAAAAAFTKITGVEIESDVRVTLPPQDGIEPDEFEQEFLDEGFLPDCTKAQTWWQEHQSQFSACIRIATGLDVSSKPSDAVLSQLNLQSRYEACLRGKYDGSWKGKVTDGSLRRCL
ncbi:FHA domain protein [Novipirellula artificiosorum]|uniref:FHA domain protein n=1 Tax=Novipirellula artificiosorum TaxID=2528016 RepID=A0A5C6DV83_9BACT|nr:FHA domain protein [Novipirellula artificiosorum]